MRQIYFDLPEQRMILIATPHCASGAVCTALAPLLPWAARWVKPADRWAKQAISKQDVLRLKPDRLVVATVRNPWDRVAAQFEALVQPKLDPALEKRGFSADMDFAAFVRHLSEKQDVFHDLALTTQSRLLFGDAGMLLPDIVMRFERLEQDFHMLAALIAARTARKKRPALCLPPTGPQPDIAAFYTRPLRLMVRKIYDEDINFFLYHFPAVPEDAPVAA